MSENNIIYKKPISGLTGKFRQPHAAFAHAYQKTVRFVARTAMTLYFRTIRDAAFFVAETVFDSADSSD